MAFKKTILPNSLRVVTSAMPQMRSVATTVFVGAGSRYETPEINGISHFLEHMLFKGTKKWPDQAAIARAIEGIGGQLNAWTDLDHTAYWNKVSKDYAKEGLTVLADMLLEPLLAPEAIERERGVILEEIKRRFDDPATYVLELAYEIMWPNQPLGNPVIGTRENILRISQADLIDYRRRLYGSKEMVVAVAGNITHEAVVEQVERLFAPATVNSAITPLPVCEQQQQPQALAYYKKTDQAHLALGVRGLAYDDPDRFAWSVLNAVLGQGMSSRLFLNIREEKGLAYHIASMTESYQDTGVLFVHAGLNLHKLEEAVRAIMEEVRALTNKPVLPKELSEVKEFLKGRINLSMDDADAVSVWYGRQELLEPQTMTPEEVIQRIEKVSADDIMRVAQRIFRPRNLNLAIIGPIKESNKYKELLEI